MKYLIILVLIIVVVLGYSYWQHRSQQQVPRKIPQITGWGIENGEIYLDVGVFGPDECPVKSKYINPDAKE